MADLEDLGTPPVFAEIVRVGYAVARLQLPTDPTLPPEMATAATRVGQAVLELQGAVDLAVELRDEGVRQAVSLIPPPGAGPDQERALIWSRHAELQASIEEFVGSSVGFPPVAGRSKEYEVVMAQAGRALVAMEEQRKVAMASHGPRLPEPPDPAPSPGPPPPTLDRDTDARPLAYDARSCGDGDRPPAAVVGAAGLEWAGREGAHRKRDASDAPTFDELERRIRNVRLEPIEPERREAGVSRPPDRELAEARDL